LHESRECVEIGVGLVLETRNGATEKRARGCSRKALEVKRFFRHAQGCQTRGDERSAFSAADRHVRRVRLGGEIADHEKGGQPLQLLAKKGDGLRRGRIGFGAPAEATRKAPELRPEAPAIEPKSSVRK
jgi:hypothetical protein